LVHRTPPRTAGTVAERWLQHAPLELPVHEGCRCPAVRQMPGGLPERAVIAALHEGEPTGWGGTDRGDLLFSPGRSRNARFHANRIARSSRAPSEGNPKLSVAATVRLTLCGR